LDEERRGLGRLPSAPLPDLDCLLARVNAPNVDIQLVPRLVSVYAIGAFHHRLAVAVFHAVTCPRRRSSNVAREIAVTSFYMKGQGLQTAEFSPAFGTAVWLYLQTAAEIQNLHIRGTRWSNTTGCFRLAAAATLAR
jgi:hypothetical protein